MSVEVGLIMALPFVLSKIIKKIECSKFKRDLIVDRMAGVSATLEQMLDKIFYNIEKHHQDSQKRKQQIAIEFQKTQEYEEQQNKIEIAAMRNEAKADLMLLQKGLEFCKTIQSNKYYSEEYEALEKEVNIVRDNLMNQTDRESLENAVNEIRNIKMGISRLVKITSKKIEQEEITQIFMEFLSQEGFHVEFNMIDDSTYSIVAEGQEKNIKLIIDANSRILADLSEGYENSYNGACEKDANALIKSLEKLGCKIEVQSDERIQPTKGGSENQIVAEYSGESKRNCR